MGKGAGMAGNDMNGRSFDAESSYAALGERVEGQGRRLTNLENTVTAGFRQVESGQAQFAAEFRSAISAITNSLAERSRAPWGIMISAGVFFLAVVTSVGALAYMPIRESQSDLKAAVAALNQSAIMRSEMDWRQERSREDRLRMEAGIGDVRSALVPRAELDRTFAAYDQRFSDIQRQIDEGNNRFGNTYTLGDYIKRITERLDMLEQRTLSPPRYSPPS